MLLQQTKISSEQILENAIKWVNTCNFLHCLSLNLSARSQQCRTRSCNSPGYLGLLWTLRDKRSTTGAQVSWSHRSIRSPMRVDRHRFRLWSFVANPRQAIVRSRSTTVWRCKTRGEACSQRMNWTELNGPVLELHCERPHWNTRVQN